MYKVEPQGRINLKKYAKIHGSSQGSNKRISENESYPQNTCGKDKSCSSE